MFSSNSMSPHENAFKVSLERISFVMINHIKRCLINISVFVMSLLVVEEVPNEETEEKRRMMEERSAKVKDIIGQLTVSWSGNNVKII